MSPLDKIGIRVAPLSHRIVIARFGNDPQVALETKDATSDFFQAIVEYGFEGKMPEIGEAIEASFGGGDEQFVMQLRRVGENIPAMPKPETKDAMIAGLLQALKEAVSGWDFGFEDEDTYPEWLPAARAVIAKAEGGAA